MAESVDTSAALSTILDLKNTFRALERAEEVIRALQQEEATVAGYKIEVAELEEKVKLLRTMDQDAEKEHEAFMKDLQDEKQEARNAFGAERSQQSAELSRITAEIEERLKRADTEYEQKISEGKEQLAKIEEEIYEKEQRLQALNKELVGLRSRMAAV